MKGLNRRQFMHRTTLALPTLIASGCVGARRGIVPHRPPPSERIHVGMIGYGTMAQDNIGSFLYNDRVQVISVCDVVSEAPLYGYKAERLGGYLPGKRKVDAFYAEKTHVHAYNACKTFDDFREQLEDPDLDAVCISTPDHWHALQTIYAANKGKHIYGQKPLFLAVAEGAEMVQAVREAGITYQVGAQSRSNDYFRMAAEFVRNGRIGKLTRVEVGLNKGHNVFGKTPAQLSEKPLAKPPPYIHFDLWLGPAPQRAFTPKIHLPMQWRYNLDYSCGMLTDFAAHQLDIMQWALNKDGEAPVAIENITGHLPPSSDLYNTLAEPFSFEIVYGDGLRVFVSSEYAYGCRFFGEGNKQIYVTNGRLETCPPELMRQKLRDDEIHLPKSGNHERNFIENISTGGPTLSPIDAGYTALLPAVLAHIGMRLGKSQLKWDAARARFVNDADADALLKPHRRGAW